MSPEKILEVILEYRRFFRKKKIELGTFNHARMPRCNEDILSHCHAMLDKIETFAKEGRTEKAFRWLGFMQGCLWSLGCYSLNDLKDHNRPKPIKKRFLCKAGFHDHEDVKTQRTKNICFGVANCHGLRVTKKCKHCGHIAYQSLNLSMPNKFLYKEEIWKD